MNTGSTYNISINRHSRTTFRINLPLNTEGIEQIVLNGVAFKLKVDDSESIARRRVILSAWKREEIGEKIDNRFRSLQKEEPNLRSYQIYSKISDESKVLLGFELSPRQVEGKHRTYVQFLEKQKRKNAPW
jgi:hypothetical protein